MLRGIARRSNKKVTIVKPKKRHLSLGLTLLLAAGAAVLIYRYFSPFHVCVRYYTVEATERGDSVEAARDYARGLCARKNPLRN